MLLPLSAGCNKEGSPVPQNKRIPLFYITECWERFTQHFQAGIETKEFGIGSYRKIFVCVVHAYVLLLILVIQGEPDKVPLHDGRAIE